MAESFAALTSGLAQELQHLTSPDQLDEAGKSRLARMLNQLHGRLEAPYKFTSRIASSSNAITITRIAIAMGVFDAFAAQHNVAMTANELRSKVRGDVQLLVRILRLLVVYGLAERVHPDKWQLNANGAQMVSGGPLAMQVIHFYLHLKSHANLLEYLEARDFRNPDDCFDGPWQFAHNTSQSYFDWMGPGGSGDDLAQKSFNTIMTINQQFRGQDWFEFFPVEERLHARSDEVLLVDIGGGLGHDSLRFRTRFSHLPGRVVLQDLPHVIDSIKTTFPTGLEAQAYDLFTPQPIRGAKAYYLRTVLHDWPDAQAIEMLGNIRPALGRDSVLLLNENIMPEEHISKIAIETDFVMMNCMAALERTERQWASLLETAGFELVKIWRPTKKGLAPHALFEAILEQPARDTRL